MARNRIVTIKNAIVSKLEGLSSIRHVYEYDKADPAGYPYVTVTIDSWEGEFGDFSAVSKRNIRTWNFNIKLYVERDEANFGPEKAERVVAEVIEEILEAFDLDLTLGGTVLSVAVIPGSLVSEQMGNVVRLAELTLSCKDIVDAA